MAIVLAGAIRMVTLLTSAWPPAAQIFKSATDMYGYYNTTNNANLSGLERIHDAFSQVHNTTCCSVIYYQTKPVRLISLLMRELPKKVSERVAPWNC
jgi:hypothetical protein